MYMAFGDKKLIEEMVIKNFLNEPLFRIPTLEEHQKVQYKIL